MKIFDWFKDDKQKKVIEVLKERDLHRRDEEINAMKKLNKRVSLITEKGDVEIIIRNVDGVIRELK